MYSTYYVIISAVSKDYSIPISERSSTPIITLSPEPSPLSKLNDGDLV